MELALSLGDTPKAFTFLDKSQKMVSKDLGFCMGLGDKGSCESDENMRSKEMVISCRNERRGSSDPVPVPVQLDLLPFSPVIPRSQTSTSFSWLTENCDFGGGKGLPRPSIGAAEKATGEDNIGSGTALSSPNSTTSSFQMEFSIYRSCRRSNSSKRSSDHFEVNEAETADRGGTSSRASDEELENGMARKKLRLTKEQSAFLEESFKEHNTLNPKQKLALAKQLNLRPRQVEVWFQNRRARTKLKQTEVDCEYLKRCCETLTEENRRLQKELQELRALKSSQPFYMQLPATTLTMCPSCERVATTNTTTNSTPTAAAGTTTTAAAPTSTTLSLAKPRGAVSFSPAQVHPHPPPPPPPPPQATS